MTCSGGLQALVRGGGPMDGTWLARETSFFLAGTGTMRSWKLLLL